MLGGGGHRPKTGRHVLRHPNIHRTRSCVQEKVCSTPGACLLLIKVAFSAEMITEGWRVSATIATARTRVRSRVSARTGRFAEGKRTISKFLSVT